MCATQASCSTCFYTEKTWPDPFPFKGTIVDLMVIPAEPDDFGNLPNALAVLDLPFSFLADVVLLPVNFLQWCFLGSPPEGLSFRAVYSRESQGYSDSQ
jgi:uncharacterized protein YceK